MKENTIYANIETIKTPPLVILIDSYADLSLKRIFNKIKKITKLPGIEYICFKFCFNQSDNSYTSTSNTSQSIEIFTCFENYLIQLISSSMPIEFSIRITGVMNQGIWELLNKLKPYEKDNKIKIDIDPSTLYLNKFNQI